VSYDKSRVFNGVSPDAGNLVSSAGTALQRRFNDPKPAPAVAGAAMTEDTAAQLQAISSNLDAHITTLRGLGCTDAASLLAIARLELQTKIHGISAAELKAVCEVIGNPPAPQAQVIEFVPRAAGKA
jgi:hypothetical protein